MFWTKKAKKILSRVDMTGDSSSSSSSSWFDWGSDDDYDDSSWWDFGGSGSSGSSSSDSSDWWNFWDDGDDYDYASDYSYTPDSYDYASDYTYEPYYPTSSYYDGWDYNDAGDFVPPDYASDYSYTPDSYDYASDFSGDNGTTWYDPNDNSTWDLAVPDPAPFVPFSGGWGYDDSGDWGYLEPDLGDSPFFDSDKASYYSLDPDMNFNYTPGSTWTVESGYVPPVDYAANNGTTWYDPNDNSTWDLAVPDPYPNTPTFDEWKGTDDDYDIDYGYTEPDTPFFDSEKASYYSRDPDMNFNYTPGSTWTVESGYVPPGDPYPNTPTFDEWKGTDDDYDIDYGYTEPDNTDYNFYNPDYNWETDDNFYTESNPDDYPWLLQDGEGDSNIFSNPNFNWDDYNLGDATYGDSDPWDMFDNYYTDNNIGGNYDWMNEDMSNPNWDLILNPNPVQPPTGQPNPNQPTNPNQPGGTTTGGGNDYSSVLAGLLAGLGGSLLGNMFGESNSGGGNNGSYVAPARTPGVDPSKLKALMPNLNVRGQSLANMISQY